jgi:threonine synthase
MAQTVYYVTAQRQVTAGSSAAPVAFAVPTGNFGNVLAGWVALQMGLPIEQLVIGSNRNDILSRWLDTGALTMTDVVPTLSPAMDIVVSSNLERLLFELAGRDGSTVADRMARFRADGSLEIPAAEMSEARRLFSGARFDDEETLATIRRVHDIAGVLVDPHTAVGIGAAIARRHDRDVPMIVHATAHPAKFPDAVEQATGTRPQLPDWLADLDTRPERFTVLPNDLEAVRSFTLAVVERGRDARA